MRKVVDGLLYNTDRAAQIAHRFDIIPGKLLFGNGLLMRKLYMTKKRRFFFSCCFSSIWFWMDDEEDIRPCSEDEARDFCMENNPVNFDVVWREKIERA